jgi:hypothetical protein
MAKKKVLSTDDQIDKLDYLTAIAKAAAAEPELIKRLGALTIYAGEVDFYGIQAARLVEQIMLKAALAEEKEPPFQPHADTYFYDNQVSTRLILKGIEKLLPFRSPDPEEEEAARCVNELASRFLEAAHRFLNYRNAIMHHIGNPKNTLDDINGICDKALSAFDDVVGRHREFFEAAAPYRFGPRELEYFYGDRE